MKLGIEVKRPISVSPCIPTKPTKVHERWTFSKANFTYFHINLCNFMPKGRMNGRRKTLRKNEFNA